MDKKDILSLNEMPYCNTNFSKFFGKECGIAGQMTKVLNSVNSHNIMSNSPTFNVYVGEDTVQAVSIDGNIDFFTKLDIKGNGKFCYGSMYDKYSYQNQFINFAILQQDDNSVVTSYSRYLTNDKDQQVSSCGVEVVSTDSHVFIENKVLLDQDGQVISASSEIGNFEDNKKFSQVYEVEGKQAGQILTDKKELLDFNKELSSITQGYCAVDGVKVSSFVTNQLDGSYNCVEKALADISSQNLFEQ